jgi:hypothetical protein
VCTVTKLDIAAKSATVFCNATFYLPAGQLVGAATIRFAENSGPTFRVPILGGTGAYTGTRGVVKLTNLGESANSNAEFHLLP